MSGRIIALLVGGLLLFCLFGLLAGAVFVPYNMMSRGMGPGGAYGPYYAPVPAPAPVQPAPAQPPAQVPYPYPYYVPVNRPFGGGFFGCLGPLFGIILILALVRLFCRPWRWHRYRREWAGFPPGFEEMHRRMHESQQQQQAGPSTPPNAGPQAGPYQPPNAGPQER